MNVMLAETLRIANGSGLIHDLFMVLIIAVCMAIVWYLGKLAAGAMGLPAMAVKVWNGLFILVGAIIVINFLLSLGGHGFITY